MTHRTEDDLLTRLRELCTCMRTPEEAEDPKCLYCEARERIEAQDRTLRLAQEKIASMQRRVREYASYD